MSRSDGLCWLSIIPKKIDNELLLLKDALLRIGGWMGNHLCIAQVGFERNYGLFLIMLSEWMYSCN